MTKIIIGAIVLYLLCWLLGGCTSWAQNMGEKCHLGYSPVTHLCADPPHMRKCSGWSPPGYCWPMPEKGE